MILISIYGSALPTVAAFSSNGSSASVMVMQQLPSVCPKQMTTSAPSCAFTCSIRKRGTGAPPDPTTLSEERSDLLHQASRRHPQEAHMAQEREVLARHLTMFAARSGQRADSCQVIIVAHTCHEEQRTHIPLLEDVLDLRRLQQWIDGHQHQPGFGRRHHEQWPVRKVRGQAGDGITRLQAQDQ